MGILKYKIASFEYLQPLESVNVYVYILAFFIDSKIIQKEQTNKI